jgi:phosphate-selective porin OprO/OprP
MEDARVRPFGVSTRVRPFGASTFVRLVQGALITLLACGAVPPANGQYGAVAPGLTPESGMPRGLTGTSISEPQIAMALQISPDGSYPGSGISTPGGVPPWHPEETAPQSAGLSAGASSQRSAVGPVGTFPGAFRPAGTTPFTPGALYPDFQANSQLSDEATLRRLRELEERVATLESQSKSQVVSLSTPNVSGSTSSTAKDVSSERFSVRPIGRVHADYVNFAGQNGPSSSAYGDLNDYFEFRRLYLGVEGSGYGVWEYRVELNFEPEQIIRDRQGNRLAETDIVQLRDVYIQHNDLPLLGSLRLGCTKVPYALEELTSSRFITFMERAAPVETFAPKRKIGVLVSHTSPSEVFGWSSGAFFENVSLLTKEHVEDKQGVDWAARGWWTPVYASEGRGLFHLGGAYVFTSDGDGWVRFRTRPEAYEAPCFLDTGSLPVDSLHRGSVEAAVVVGSWSLQGELFAVQTQSVGGHPDYNFHGAYAYVSYFLTGEHRPYKRHRGTFERVIPHTNFWWVRTPEGPCFGWGAWELAFRWSWTDLEDAGLAAPLAGQMHNLTLAVNWYWNPQLRMMFEWIHAMADVRREVESTHTDILGLSWRADF